jgi:hypothetical protein
MEALLCPFHIRENTAFLLPPEDTATDDILAPKVGSSLFIKLLEP